MRNNSWQSVGCYSHDPQPAMLLTLGAPRKVKTAILMVLDTLRYILLIKYTLQFILPNLLSNVFISAAFIINLSRSYMFRMHERGLVSVLIHSKSLSLLEFSSSFFIRLSTALPSCTLFHVPFLLQLPAFLHFPDFHKLASSPLYPILNLTHFH